MTDSLVMEAVDNLDPADLAVRSIAAGADIMLQPQDLPTAHRALIDAVGNGTLAESQLDEAVMRVLRLKAQLGLLPPTGVSPELAPGSDAASGAGDDDAS